MLISILAPLVMFGIIVLVHEGGHFVCAKLTGMRVDEFAIGFGPVIWSKKRGETLYSLRLIPLGGFNKLPGWSRARRTIRAPLRRVPSGRGSSSFPPVRS